MRGVRPEVGGRDEPSGRPRPACGPRRAPTLRGHMSSAGTDPGRRSATGPRKGRRPSGRDPCRRPTAPGPTCPPSSSGHPLDPGRRAVPSAQPGSRAGLALRRRRRGAPAGARAPPSSRLPEQLDASTPVVAPATGRGPAAPPRVSAHDARSEAGAGRAPRAPQPEPVGHQHDRLHLVLARSGRGGRPADRARRRGRRRVQPSQGEDHEPEPSDAVQRGAGSAATNHGASSRGRVVAERVPGPGGGAGRPAAGRPAPAIRTMLAGPAPDWSTSAWGRAAIAPRLLRRVAASATIAVPRKWAAASRSPNSSSWATTWTSSARSTSATAALGEAGCSRRRRRRLRRRPRAASRNPAPLRQRTPSRPPATTSSRRASSPATVAVQRSSCSAVTGPRRSMSTTSRPSRIERDPGQAGQGQTVGRQALGHPDEPAAVSPGAGGRGRGRAGRPRSSRHRGPVGGTWSEDRCLRRGSVRSAGRQRAVGGEQDAGPRVAERPAPILFIT